MNSDANIPDSPHESPGGQGGLMLDSGRARGDLKLLERAIREGWPVSPEIKSAAVKRAAKVLRSADARSIVAAAKVLVMMDLANISRERLALDATPTGAAHVHYEYHNHQKLTEEEYQRRAARLQCENGEQKHSGNGPT